MKGSNFAERRTSTNAGHSGKLIQADRRVLAFTIALFLGAAAQLPAQTPIAPIPVSINSKVQPCGAVILLQQDRVMLCAEGQLWVSDMQGRRQQIVVDTTVLPTLTALWHWKADSVFLLSESRRTAAIMDASGKIARTIQYIRPGGSPTGDRIIGVTTTGELIHRDREITSEVLGREHELQDTVRLLAVAPRRSRVASSWVAAGEHISRIGMHGAVLEPLFVRRLLLASGPNLIAAGYSDSNGIDVLDLQGRRTRKIRPGRADSLNADVLRRMERTFIEAGDPETRPHRERLLTRLEATPQVQNMESLFVDADDRVWIKRRKNAGCEWEIHPGANAAVRRVPMICDLEPVSARGNYLVTWGAGMVRVWRFGQASR